MNSKDQIILPIKEKKNIRDEKIRMLYKRGYSMDDICVMEQVSKTTVFFAIQGRSKKNGGKIKKLPVKK